MGRKKNVSKSVQKSSCKSKEMFLSNLKLTPQPVVCLTKLHIPEAFKNDKTNQFTINVNSKRFKNLLTNSNAHQSKSKGGSFKTVKPVKKICKNKRQSFLESKTNLLVPNSETRTNGTRQKVLSIPIKNDTGLFIDQSADETCISNIKSDPNWSVNKENQYSDTKSVDTQEFELEDETTYFEGNLAESKNRTDKAIDTFLHVLRKTTDDNSIVLALQRDYICEICQQGFLKKGSLRKHMVICGLGNRGKKSKKQKKLENYSCPVCKITYLNKYSLDKHNANVHNLKKMYKCLVCSQNFYHEDALTLHCRSRHGLGGSNIYKCPYCENAFNIRGDLNYHCRKVHNTTRYYVCSKCLECFKNEDTCKLHEQSHGYSCDICMHKTKNESEMIAHRSTHLYMVVYRCDRCLRTFKAKRYFTKHIKVHEREKKL